MAKYPSLLVVSSCTGAKRAKPANQLVLSDFRQGREHLSRREQELAPYRMAAKLMYTGMQHQQVSQAFDLLRTRRNVVSRLEIISAGYGLIHQYDFIVPYETTFNDLKRREVLDWSRQLRIHEDLNARVQEYDIVVFLLGENYLRSALLPLESRPDQSFIFLASGGSAAVLPQHAAKQAVLPLVNKDARRFGYGMVGLKGFLFHQLAHAVVDRPEVLCEWHADPHAAIEYLEAWQAQRTSPVLLSVEEQSAEPEPNTTRKPAPLSVHRSGLGFNPQGLSSAEFYPPPQHTLPVTPRSRFTVVINNRDKLKIARDAGGHPLPAPRMERIWNFIEGAPRGYLTSLAYHNPDSDPLPQSAEGNIYDCGAWSYKSEPYPILKKKNGPLTPDGTMHLFETAGAREGMDIIVSPDMMILDGLDSPQRAREKIEVSLRFARDMQPLAGRHRLMAVTHGTFEQRHEMMERYLDLGYRHVALGSLAPKSSRDPYFVYQCVEDALQYRAQDPSLYIHVLGVSSIKWAATLTHLGVDSFDGSSMYMSAFTGGTFMRYVPDSPELLRKYRIVENVPGSDELPPCTCPACAAMRDEGWDTRAQGGKPNDPTGRPYNGGNEANMGRAVHNINMYLRALQDVQARILAGDESLLVKRDRYEAARDRRSQQEHEVERLLN
ncbi:DUF6884 domain-containing protein [Deinococcus aerophilus]|uniref:tRNA-guanine(15) transglycosylase-like domain-containing protein n=1 Tax=Deinococcus aerophilus TaxID=522488 RepID=A0ABQ2GWK3_9DEIO|nr:DUF6884 domain-containing protein [Deinococcus aerophilus]GGM17307.1 hypothetical protein GCM10010841_26940 [Deinococcus aerophilus]